MGDLFEPMGGLDAVAPVRQEIKTFAEQNAARIALYARGDALLRSLASQPGLDIFEILPMLDDISKWVIGDDILARTREATPMVAYREAAQRMGKSVRWALELRIVAEAFPAPYRVAGVPWRAYRNIAREDNRFELLVEMSERGWTRPPKDAAAAPG